MKSAAVLQLKSKKWKSIDLTTEFNNEQGTYYLVISFKIKFLCFAPDFD